MLEHNSPYGYCPICGNPGLERERCPNGHDQCQLQHKYLSSDAVSFDSALKIKVLNKLFENNGKMIDELAQSLREEPEDWID